MGFSISAATALIFASLFLAFGIFYPAMANGYERVEEADAAKADRDLAQAQTDIELDSSSANTAGPGLQDLTIVVDNTGQTTLTVSETDILVNGNYIDWTNDNNGDAVRTTIGGNQQTDVWLPNETMTIVYGHNTGPISSVSSPYNFKVVTEHGVSISGVES
ncbi:MAG: putative archaeal flagellar protein F [Halonotius sp. J07HN6]|jgi:Putative archaeal flagellar protein F|nr:MAG: putative archaeal flagellar protein F [Halonotius sp. J07HN6]